MFRHFASHLWIVFLLSISAGLIFSHAPQLKNLVQSNSTDLSILFFIMVVSSGIYSTVTGYGKFKREFLPKEVKNTNSVPYGWILEELKCICLKHKIQEPKLAVYDSNRMNAYAAGYSKNTNIICLSSKMAEYMSRDEIRAVLGHELSHIKNGEILKTSLFSGGTIGVILFVLLSVINGSSEMNGTTLVILAFGLICFYFTMRLSSLKIRRDNEYLADLHGSKVAGFDNMISSLYTLATFSPKRPLSSRYAAIGVAGGQSLGSAIKTCFRGHPSFSMRIKALQRYQENINRHNPRLKLIK